MPSRHEMSTKNSELLSFGEKTNSTSKSGASKISIKVVLVSSVGTVLSPMMM